MTRRSPAGSTPFHEPRDPAAGRHRHDITTVGLGAWAVGGPWAFGWGPQDDEHSIAAIHHAVERGINWVDTAPAYGLGHSEEVVGRALAALPQADRPLVFTTCGMYFDEAGPGVVAQFLLAPTRSAPSASGR